MTPAQVRALDAISGRDGIVIGVAADHRDAFRAALRKCGLADVPDAWVTDFKLRLARALGDGATVMLLDAEYAAGQAIVAGALPGTTALAVPLEAQGYGDVASVDRTTFLPGWGPAQARRLGAAACKLLLPYRVDVPEQAAAQEDVVRAAVAGCREHGLALILEPIVYARPGEDRGGARFPQLVIEGARRLAALGPDLLKLQYPGSYEACLELDAACGPATPWVLLGGGADERSLLAQVADASRAGASGFIVGRTLFDAALVDDRDASEHALATVSRPMLDRLAATARASATSWRERVGPLPEPPRDWYRA